MRKGLLLILIVALLALPLALVLRDLSRAILTETMRLVWSARQQLEALSQTTIWGFLLVLVLVAAIGSLFGWSQTRLGRDRPTAVVLGRVQELSRWIRRATQGRYFRWTLDRYVTNLAWEVLAFRERTTPRRCKQRVRAGEIELPPGVLEFLESSVRLQPTPPRSLWRFLRRLAPGRSRTRLPRAQPALEDIVDFLEAQMEVEDDRGTS